MAERKTGATKKAARDKVPRGWLKEGDIIGEGHTSVIVFSAAGREKVQGDARLVKTIHKGGIVLEPPQPAALERMARNYAFITFTEMGPQRYHEGKAFPLMTKEKLLQANFDDDRTLLAVSNYLYESAERLFGPTFDPEEWRKTMIPAQGEMVVGAEVTPFISSYARGMLRFARGAAEDIGIDGYNPVVEYIAAKTFLHAKSEERHKNGEKQTSDANEEGQKYEAMEERLRVFAKIHELDNMTATLDGIAEDIYSSVPIKKTFIQEKVTQENVPLGSAKFDEIDTTQEAVTKRKKFIRNPILTILQQEKLFALMRTPGRTVNDLFQDKQFRADMQEQDTTKWQNVYEEYKKGDIGDVLIACNRGFLHIMAKKYIRQPLAFGMPYDAIYAAGEIGMRKAMERFDPEFKVRDEKVKFSTYAERYVDNEIQTLIRAEHGISRYHHTHLNILSQIRYAFFQVEGRDPVESEIREQLLHNTLFSQKMINYVIGFEQTHRLASLNSALQTTERNKGGHVATLEDFIPDVSVIQGTDRDETNMQKEALLASFGRLTDLQQRIVYDSYGMNPEKEPLTPFEIAERYEADGITETQVAVILQEAFAILRGGDELKGVARGRTKQSAELSTDDVDEELFQAALSVEENMSNKDRVRILSSRLYKAQIARKIGITSEAVRHIQNKLVATGELTNVVKRESQGMKFKERIIALYNDDVNTKKIAEELGLTPYIVSITINNLINQKLLVKRKLNRFERLLLAPLPSSEVALVAQWLDETHAKAKFWKDVKKHPSTKAYQKALAKGPSEEVQEDEPKPDSHSVYGPKLTKAREYVLGLGPGEKITAPELAAATSVALITAGDAIRSLDAEGKVIIGRGSRPALVLGESVDQSRNIGPKTKIAVDYIESLQTKYPPTIKAIAAATGVSLGIADAALDILVNEGKFSKPTRSERAKRRSRDSMYVKGINYIKDGVADGSLPSGTRITNEFLSEHADITLSAATRAITELRNCGVLKGKQKIGTFVK